jgi:multiple sugar transport system substrate-binding protein
MRLAAVVLAFVLALAPLGTRGADLVVWWEQGFYPQADQGVRETVATFEQDTGKQVELVQPAEDEIMKRAASALQAGAPPDFLFSARIENSAARWAYDDRLVDLGDVLGPVLDLFDADAIETSMLTDGKTGRSGLYALPVGRISNHVHVWNSLLERAGFTLTDIPQGWEEFWSFWCDRVQPAVRKATGREDIWAVGLPMSAAATIDTEFELTQFQLAYQTSWLARDRRVQVEDPKVQAGMIRAMTAYTEIWRKGCTPPDSVNWTNISNNKAFLGQTVVMTANATLSIPAALRTARPDDYYRNAATIDWPRAVDGEPLVLEGRVDRAVVFKDGGHGDVAKQFVRFLAERGLAHWVTFMGDQWMPPMRKLVEQPFWLNPSDPHRMRAAIQILTQPHLLDMDVRDNEWRSGPIWDENVWGNAVHRVVADGITPEQAVDEAIARIKQILAE